MTESAPGIYNVPAKEYILNQYSRGYSECKDNNWMYAIYAQDPNVSIYQNEYIAGFIQGKVQGELAIRAARNNTWKNNIICACSQYAINIDVTPELNEACRKALVDNYNWLYEYVAAHQDDPKARGITRLMMRMLGIWAGVNNDKPQLADAKVEDLSLAAIGEAQQKFNFGEDPCTFLDIYFINAQMDLFDGIDGLLNLEGYMSKEGKDVANEQIRLTAQNNDVLPAKSDHCTAFCKMLPDGDILWTHNSWAPFWAQSCAVTYCIGEDFVTQNAVSQGQFGSNTDFGFNKNGICFNETTNVNFYCESKLLGIWLTWRSAAAEQFSASIDEFYEYISMDNTGTYLSAYMVIDALRNEMGLVDMSYSRFALFKSDGETVTVTDSTGYKPTFLDYDQHLITPKFFLGVNQAPYKKILYELHSFNTRPMRRVQLFRNMNWVQNVEDAKRLITYTEDREPLSIYGRWDLGFGTTETPRIRPDGSQDAKAFSTKMVKEILNNLSCKPSLNGDKTSFWMKFGTPYINGTPFVWSHSIFAEFKAPMSVDFVPDRLDGYWNRVNMFME